MEKAAGSVKDATADPAQPDVVHQPPPHPPPTTLPPASSKSAIDVPYEPRQNPPVQKGTVTPPNKRSLLGRVILAGEVVLTSLEASVANIVTSGTTAASTAAG